MRGCGNCVCVGCLRKHEEDQVVGLQSCRYCGERKVECLEKKCLKGQQNPLTRLGENGGWLVV